LKEDQAFSLSLELGTKRKSYAASVCRFPSLPPPVPDLFMADSETVLHFVGGGGKDFVDTIIAVKLL
jgi:hypothetical protein